MPFSSLDTSSNTIEFFYIQLQDIGSSCQNTMPEINSEVLLLFSGLARTRRTLRATYRNYGGGGEPGDQENSGQPESFMKIKTIARKTLRGSRRLARQQSTLFENTWVSTRKVQNIYSKHALVIVKLNFMLDLRPWFL